MGQSTINQILTFDLLYLQHYKYLFCYSVATGNQRHKFFCFGIDPFRNILLNNFVLFRHCINLRALLHTGPNLIFKATPAQKYLHEKSTVFLPNFFSVNFVLYLFKQRTSMVEIIQGDTYTKAQLFFVTIISISHTSDDDIISFDRNYSKLFKFCDSVF